MAARDFGPEMQSDFERKRDEMMNYFLGEFLDLYAYYDEIQPDETLVISIDIEAPESAVESYGFSITKKIAPDKPGFSFQ